MSTAADDVWHSNQQYLDFFSFLIWPDDQIKAKNNSQLYLGKLFRLGLQAKPPWYSTIEFKRRHSSNHEMESHTQAGFAFQIQFHVFVS